MAHDEPEDEFAARQDPRLYPVGRFLRATYHADNHETLDPVTTRLMLDLARIELAEAQEEAGAPPPQRHGEGAGLLRTMLNALARNPTRN